ncbi:MAG: hypothetical protein ACJ76N_03225 [Thermoanaerobaculia bacterium]
MDADQKNDAWRAGPGAVAVLTIIGIVTGLGITRAVGCVIQPPWIDAPWNILLSMVMLTFAGISVVTNRQIARVLMSVEFVGFVLFLLFLRGGYAVGISAAPSSRVMEYDALSVAVRISVLGLLFLGRSPSRRFLFSVALVSVGAALVIVGVKAALFRLPTW